MFKASSPGIACINFLAIYMNLIVSALFGLVRVGAPHGTVLSGRIAPLVSPSLLTAPVFYRFFSKGNFFTRIYFIYSNITIYIQIHNYNIIPPFNMPFDWEHQMHKYYLLHWSKLCSE